MRPAAARSITTDQWTCLCTHALGLHHRADANVRSYTAELLVLLRLLRACDLVTDPTTANLFVVPFLMGSWRAIKFVYPHFRPAHLEGLHAELRRHLPHYSEATAASHLFFFTQACLA